MYVFNTGEYYLNFVVEKVFNFNNSNFILKNPLKTTKCFFKDVRL